jgi:hypothetical protein
MLFSFSSRVTCHSKDPLDILSVFGLCCAWKQRRPEVHLFAARFREQEGDVKGARSAYEVLSSELAPGLLGATVKHANFEHRQVLVMSS